MTPTKRKRLPRCVMGATILLSLVTLPEAMGQSSPNFILEGSTLSGGGGSASSPSFSLFSTIAQPEPVGEAMSESFTLVLGIINEASTLRLLVEIKPGKGPTCIKPDGKGRIAVAVLGGSVDVETILPETVRISGQYPIANGVPPIRSASNKDVSNDNIPDFVASFYTQALAAAGLLIDGKTLYLGGRLSTGVEFIGSDRVFLAGGPSCPE